MTKKTSLFLLFFSILLPDFLLAEKGAWKLKLRNGTTGLDGEAESVRLFILKEAMVPIGEWKNIRSELELSSISVPPDLPLLVQVSYKGQNYNKMIPPVPEFRNKDIVLDVYETTADKSGVSMRSLVQFARFSDRLQVYKIYIVQNSANPPKAYLDPEGLGVYIPENAFDISASWTQSGSQMPIPVPLEEKKLGERVMRRALLPGSTEIQISYFLPWKEGDLQVRDQLLFEKGFGEISRPIFIRPLDMDFRPARNTSFRELADDIPKGLKAYMVRYDGKDQSMEFVLSGGTPIVPRFVQTPREIVNGTWFPDWHTSLVGIIGILSLLFTIQFSMEYFAKRRYGK